MDDFFAAFVFKVDIDVGRLVALAADEALKQHRLPRRINLGDAQAIAHRAIGRRAAALAQDVARAGKGDDVVHGQKIMLVVQFSDQPEFVVDECLHLGRHALGPAAQGAFLRELAQVFCSGLACGHHLGGVLVAQFVQAEVAALGHRQGLRQQFGRKELAQAHAAAQMLFGIGQQGQAAFGERQP